MNEFKLKSEEIIMEGIDSMWVQFFKLYVLHVAVIQCESVEGSQEEKEKTEGEVS